MKLQSVSTCHSCPPVSLRSFDPRRNGAVLILKSSNSSIRFSIKGRFRKGRAMAYLPNSDASTPIPDLKTSNGVPSPEASPRPGMVGIEPLRGKPGYVSFSGLSYQMLEESELVSSPFKEDARSFVWVVGPVALISSLLLPQLFLGNAIDAFLQDPILAEIVTLLSSEIIFYFGLATFLSVTNHVQQPYLEFSSKRWSLITGLRGYLTSAFFTMGLKVLAPLFAVLCFWPPLGLASVIAVAPFLLGCAVQCAFEMYLEQHRSSCWPLLPIIFEVYRLYQLNRGAHFLEKLLFSMRNAAVTPAMVERSGALLSMVMVFQLLGIVCLWSLTTFLLRLFPSRPVAENY
ncbi:uncharacterized protein LOC120276835 [Dioscorea cayenensis subsp. rotundata]|uniref:Uncharacterized protein LOC120276835 n=1 Tax=Dioscorea cayennensis subsp. rotundata TaxID=55577 RepID=A0AB40CMR6_DIOCR|nr:uncharacterized protein LOC120276835 [Dioscorea cayenensis subsp. rotundata]